MCIKRISKQRLGGCCRAAMLNGIFICPKCGKTIVMGDHFQLQLVLKNDERRILLDLKAIFEYKLQRGRISTDDIKSGNKLLVRDYNFSYTDFYTLITEIQNKYKNKIDKKDFEALCTKYYKLTLLDIFKLMRIYHTKNKMRYIHRINNIKTR